MPGRGILPPRLCCAADAEAHASKDPWLGHLWVVWSVAGPEPVWTVARTDGAGYLIAAPKDGEKGALPVRWSEGATYLLYLVRTDRALAEQVRVAAGAEQRFGEPLRLSGEVQQSKKRGTPSLVFAVPESPDSYLPKGSELTLGWCLLRDMPNDRCAPVRRAVKRLQYALGAMRYPVGSQGHPYTPEDVPPAAPQGDDAPALDPNPSAGEFDVRTWSAVLAFQRDANRKRFANAPPRAFAKVLRAAAAASEPEVRAELERLGALYAKPAGGAAADLDAEPGADCPDDEAAPLAGLLGAGDAVSAARMAASRQDLLLHEDGVVDAAAGGALQTWIAARLRKQDPILLPLPHWPGARDCLWGRPELVEALVGWRDELQRLGWAQGIPAAHTYRNATADMIPRYGADKRSIHKTGLAVDLRNVRTKVGSGPVAGIFDVILVQVRGDPPRFELWGEVDQPSADAADAHYYKATIDGWAFDAHDPSGGKVTPRTPKSAGGRFLNLTAVGAAHGLESISGMALGCFDLPAATLTLAEDQLERFVHRLWAQKKQVAKDDRRKDALENDHKLLSTWAGLTKGLGGHALDLMLDPQGCRADAKARDAIVNGLGGCSFAVTNYAMEENAASIDFTLQEATIKVEGTPPELDQFVTLRPVTQSFTFERGAQVDFPEYVGDPNGLEWWHFQRTDLVRGRVWSELLLELGWTREGLGGRSALNGVCGLGFTAKELDPPKRAAAGPAAGSKKGRIG